MREREMKLSLRGRGCTNGIVETEAVVSKRPFGFWQGIDPQTGIVIDRRHDLSGESIKGKAFVFPYGRGSTGTPGIFLEAVRNNVAPAAIINLKSEPMIIVCALLAEEFYETQIPVIDGLDCNPIETVRTGDRVRVDGQKGIIEVIREG
jgi:predicted aconitase with swiveling domain